MALFGSNSTVKNMKQKENKNNKKFNDEITGFLEKKGQGLLWKRRYFIKKENFLFYYAFKVRSGMSILGVFFPPISLFTLSTYILIISPLGAYSCIKECFAFGSY